MVDIKKIEKLMTAMGRHKMKRILVKEEGVELELERDCGGEIVRTQTVDPTYLQQLASLSSEETSPTPSVDESSIFITSPMVGTFYSAPSPEDTPYTKVGDDVDEESVVCIVEAMKVMNEVKAGLKGRVAEILLKNGDPVEFGTKIIRVTAV